MNKFEIMRLNLTALEPHTTNGGRGILKQLRGMVECMIEAEKPQERISPTRMKGAL